MKDVKLKRLLLYVAVAPLVICGVVLMFCGILVKSAAYLCLLDISGAEYEIRKIK